MVVHSQEIESYVDTEKKGEKSAPKNNTSEKGKEGKNGEKEATATVSSSGIVSDASPSTTPDPIGAVTIDKKDETPANSSVTNSGMVKSKKPVKPAKIIVAVLLGLTIVGAIIGAAVGWAKTQDKVDKTAGQLGVVSGQLAEEENNKNNAINNNQQTITAFYNTVAQNVEKAVADYNDAKGAFNAIGKNPGDPNYDAIAEVNGALQDKYNSLAALQAEFEVYATQYKNGELSDKVYREILTQLNNQANQVINEADNLENLCANYSVYSVTVDQSALSKDKVQKLLGDKTIVGKVTGVESCKYWSDTGKVQIVVKIQEAERPGVTAKEYIRVIEADVTPGQKTTSFKIITDELAGNKTVEARTYECGQQSDMGANANSNIKVGYSQSAKRDPKTGLITSEAGAVVMIYDDTGALVDIEVFSADSQTDAKDHTPEMLEQLKEETQEYIKSLQLQGMKVVGKIDNYFLLVQDDERGM